MQFQDLTFINEKPKRAIALYTKETLNAVACDPMNNTNFDEKPVGAVYWW